MASSSEKSKRARKLLKRLLTIQQWDDFQAFESFREVVNGERTWLIEIGMKLQGWIQFHDMDGKDPHFFRSAGVVSSQRGWCMEDLLISLLLLVRTNTGAVNPKWSCQSRIDGSLSKKIVDRTFHSDLATKAS